MPQQRATVLLIDDDRDMRWAMRNILADAGFAVAEAEAGGPGLQKAFESPPDAVLLDMRLPDLGGDEVMRRFQRFDQGLPIIIVTAHGSIPGAVSAIRSGALEYITKPFRNDHLLATVQRAVARRRIPRPVRQGGLRATVTGIMGTGCSIQRLVDEIEAVVATDYSVMIYGETGSGKEVVARSLYQHGLRASRPFVVVDCGAIAEHLTDSEFFGHEKGAYTGAIGRHRGWFETAAKGGTIFLDEIGNLAPIGQKALLRTLEERSIRRIGGTQIIDLDVRVIAATNDDLKERAKAGSFREDLLFRLAEYVITVPPLRTRPEDIAFLAYRFLAEARESLGRRPIDILPTALDMLHGYRWPGNVRELRSVMRRVALTSSDIVTAARVAESIDKDGTHAISSPQDPSSATPLRQRVKGQVRAIERDAVIDALERARGNKAEAARLLGIDYKTYRTKLKLLSEPQGSRP